MRLVEIAVLDVINVVSNGLDLVIVISIQVTNNHRFRIVGYLKDAWIIGSGVAVSNLDVFLMDKLVGFIAVRKQSTDYGIDIIFVYYSDPFVPEI